MNFFLNLTKLTRLYSLISLLLLASVSQLLMSCASTVWIIEKREGAGVVGYQDAQYKDFNKKFREASINICNGQDYKVVADKMNGRSWSYTATENMRSTYNVNDAYGNKLGEVEGTREVPVTRTQYEGWREAQIICLDGTSAYKYPNGAPALGTDVTDSRSDSKGGVYVRIVGPYSPASRAGIVKKERIYEVDGKAVNSADDFHRLVSGLKNKTPTVKVCEDANVNCREITVPLILAH